MVKFNSSNILIFLSPLLFFIFLLFIFQEAYAQNDIFSAGYYKDHGPILSAPDCPDGYWQAQIEIKDFDEKPLIIDTLKIRAIYYEALEDGGFGSGQEVYNSGELKNIDSFTTPCSYETGGIEIKGGGLMVLEVEAAKDGYYGMKASNEVRSSGSTLNRRKWSRILYMASADTEEVNINFISPEYNQWINASANMEFFVNNWPFSDKPITDIVLEIKHSNTGEKESYIIAPEEVTEGVIDLPMPDLAEIGIGEFVWRIALMRNSAGILYNEKERSLFNYDPYPPSVSASSFVLVLGGGEEQVVRISTRLEDVPTPSSGLSKVEFYVDDGSGGELQIVDRCTVIYNPSKTIDSPYCTATDPKEYEVETTYRWQVIVYDFAGNTTEKEGTETVYVRELGYITVYGYFPYNSPGEQNVEGVDFEITEVRPDEPGFPDIGTHYTTWKFPINESFSMDLMAPEQAPDGTKFSYWTPGICNNLREHTAHLTFGTRSTRRMHFGISRLLFNMRTMSHADGMSSELIKELQAKETAIEQISGTPVLEGGSYIGGFTNFSRSVEGPMEDLTFKFFDSDDGVLIFRGLFTGFCQAVEDPADPESWRKCSGEIMYGCESIPRNYWIQRKITVEAYLDGDLIGNIEILKESGEMEGGTTNNDEYDPEYGSYAFTSIIRPNRFIGKLKASTTITEQNFIFSHWENCSDDSTITDKHICSILSEKWVENVGITIKAHYEGSEESEFLELITEIDGHGEISGNVSSTGELISCVGPDPGSCYFDRLIKEEEINFTAEPDDYWEFTEWHNCDEVNNEDCRVIMDESKTVRATFQREKPEAKIKCEPADCGNGCICNNGDGWLAYTFTNYKVLNDSDFPDPGAEYTCTWWYYKKDELPGEAYKSCTGVGDCRVDEDNCDFGIANTPQGENIIKLKVEDEYGASSETEKNIQIKWDIAANFKCSLDEEDEEGEDCATVRPFAEQPVYFIDHSLASEDSEIESWIWKRWNGSDWEEFHVGEEGAFTAIDKENNKILLTVTDDVPRTASAEKTLQLKMLLPKYQEVVPR